jgi:hypothetical protein
MEDAIVAVMLFEANMLITTSSLGDEDSTIWKSRGSGRSRGERAHAMRP